MIKTYNLIKLSTLIQALCQMRKLAYYLKKFHHGVKNFQERADRFSGTGGVLNIQGVPAGRSGPRYPLIRLRALGAFFSWKMLLQTANHPLPTKKGRYPLLSLTQGFRPDSEVFTASYYTPLRRDARRLLM